MRFRIWQEEEWEHLLKEVLHEELDKEPPIDAATSYQQMKEIRKQKYKKKRNKSWILIPVGMCLLLIGFILSPGNTNAFNQLTEFLQKIQGKALNITIAPENSSSEASPTTNDMGEVHESPVVIKEMDMNEIKNIYGFPVMYPRKEELELLSTEGIILRDNIIEVHLVYYDVSTEAEIKIVEKDMRDTGIGIMVSEEDTNTQEFIDSRNTRILYRIRYWFKRGHVGETRRTH